MNKFFEGVVSAEYFYLCIDDSNIPYPEYNLFASQGIYPFVKYEKELGLINEYCFTITKTFSKQLEDAEQKLKIQKIEKIEPFAEGYGYFTSYEYEESLQGILWDRQWLFEIVTAAQLVMLLSSFFETKAREIYEWFIKDKIIEIGAFDKKTAKIDMYLKSLQTKNCHLDKLDDIISFFRQVRKVRNLFVHEQWDDLTRHLSEIKLCEIIGRISAAFYIIEDIYIKNRQN
ncbi:MAG: hypothetical protein LBH95_09025 [Oscillospiraceae bacterium]|jgi:hypothetical protein|nr:hypothetical protein [Oscillospiraceae bacterium]